jgi:PIN domain nuclease of toxin-antitoxin system
MKIICDTHVLLFWADSPEKLSSTALDAVEAGIAKGHLACSDISFWEIAMLFKNGKLSRNAEPLNYMNDLVLGLNLTVYPVTPEIALLSQADFFPHKDPADRLIAATALHHRLPLLTADKTLRQIDRLNIIW